MFIIIYRKTLIKYLNYDKTVEPSSAFYNLHEAERGSKPIYEISNK